MKLYVCKHCSRWAVVDVDEVITVASVESGVTFPEGDEMPRCLNHESEPFMEEAAAVPVADVPLTQELFAAVRSFFAECDKNGTTLGWQAIPVGRMRKAVGL